MKITQSKKNLCAWIWTILYSILIFLTVPFAFSIQKYVTENLGKNAFIYIILSIFGLSFLLLLYILIFKLGIRSPSKYIWLFVITSLYLIFILKLAKSPAETIHFLEYGILGLFLFKALKFHIKDISIYFTATLLSMIIGTFDEILQWITPRRFWGFHDIWINTLSGGLILLTLWTVIRPEEISGKLKLKSLKVLSSIIIVCILIMGLCASNTPKRVFSYTNFISCLSYLQKEEPMSEYGYKIKDKEIGIFYSRFNRDELKKIDKQKKVEISQELEKSWMMKYDEFLKKYNPVSNPFIHEFRVHVFRRDVNSNEAKKTFDLNEKREYIFIAYKENLILEKYFENILKNSAQTWEKTEIKEAEDLIDKSKFYKSPVSANLITIISEKTMWASIISIIFILIIVNLILYMKEKHQKKHLI